MTAARCDTKTEKAMSMTCCELCTPGLSHPLDPAAVSVCVCVCMHASRFEQAPNGDMDCECACKSILLSVRGCVLCVHVSLLLAALSY